MTCIDKFESIYKKAPAGGASCPFKKALPHLRFSIVNATASSPTKKAI